MRPLKFFLDFDGTVTTVDVVDRMLERFAGEEWKQIEKDWVEGKIGSRECLSRQMALVSATEDEFKGLIAEVSLDAGFGSFLKRARNLAVPVSIVSDGFDFIIREILKRGLAREQVLLENLAVYSNRLFWSGTRLRTAFSENGCGHGCANCKERIIRRFSSRGDSVVFVGDGLSDRFAARVSDVVFAKGKLADFCRQTDITYEPYQTFSDIEKWLSQNS